MSTTRAILCGQTSLEEITNTLRTSGKLAGEVEVIPGTAPVVGILVFTTMSHPDARRALWVFDGSLPDASPEILAHRHKLPDQVTLLSIGAAGGGPELLASLTTVFGGYLYRNEAASWERLGPDPVSDEAGLLGTKIADQTRDHLSAEDLQAAFRVLQDPRGRDAFIAAWRTVALATAPQFK